MSDPPPTHLRASQVQDERPLLRRRQGDITSFLSPTALGPGLGPRRPAVTQQAQLPGND